MPFAQFFNGGQAFHGDHGTIYDRNGGSHGCVNLRYDDAKGCGTCCTCRIASTPGAAAPVRELHPAASGPPAPAMSRPRVSGEGHARRLVRDCSR
ncbi:L,D-transpeptidase [Streptomyces sp. NPDC048639]|uniref:L,D-transpeptidase n=1 Tax=Streptomyces sp. NPDC048639 TaxID=3365581 RepID=UPI0037238852